VPRIHIVTDSNADIPHDLAARLGIVVVPSLVIINEHAYRDGLELSRAEFYTKLPDMRPPPTTAAPSSGEFQEVYRACGPGPIVSLHLASAFSAICDVARLAGEGLAGQVTVVDTGSVSLGQGWPVIAAAEAAAAGMDLAGVLAAAQSAQSRVRLWAALDTVEYLRRSGRANALSALLGDLLQIKPLLEVRGGKVTPVARLRTRQKAREALAAQVEGLGPLERLAVLHTAAPADAHTLAAQLAHLVPIPPLVVEATAVIGTHVGPGALGLAAVART
jgi:DegV family protein with EDD domain